MIAPACRNDVAHSLEITEIKFSILQKLTILVILIPPFYTTK